MASNQAAWIESKQAKPLKVGPADLPKAGPDDVVVKNYAIAINPVDWKIQDTGFYLQKYPNVLGEDVAGEVVEVGENVKDIKKGDRVLAHAHGLMTNDPANGGFQNYTAVRALITSKIPSSISYPQAAVLPLALDTAAIGLFGQGHLALPHPSLSPKPSNKVILIWGGSSSVGATAVQLAKSAGIEVITTTSSHNHEWATSQLGADHVFDHKSSSVVDDIVKAVKSSGKEFGGVYDAISLDASFKPIGQIITQLSGSKKLSTVLPPQGLPEGVEAVGIFAVTTLNKDEDVGHAIWDSYIYNALEKGIIKPLPEPQIVGKGLEHVQAGCDANKAGVSAKKVVIEL